MPDFLGRVHLAIASRMSRWRAALDALFGTSRSANSRPILLLVLGCIVVAAAVTVTAVLNSFVGLLVLDASLGAILLWVLLAVRRWFGHVPPEGSIALGTYATSILGSAAALVLTHEQTWFGGVWIVAVVGWTFSAVYALYHAPEELELGAPA